MMKTIASIAAAAGIAATASAGVVDFYQFTWNAGDPSGSINNAAGTFQQIVSTYNPTTEQITFRVTFSDQLADGFTVALNDGGDPKNEGGQLALVYFDGTNLASPQVSAYAYNGEVDQTSHRDGSSAPGTQAPDRLFPAGTPGVTATAEDTMSGGREFFFSFDATSVNAHIPLYPNSDGISDWSGISFAESLGIWLHPVTGLNTAYDSEGFLTNWLGTRQGWFDASSLETEVFLVPTSGSVVLLGLGGFLATRRRRD